MLEAILGSGMLINGLLNAVASSMNASKNCANAQAMQAMNQQFQEALQERQWERTSRLQLQLRELAAREAASAQERAFAHQEEVINQQAFLNSWPLSLPPAALLGEFARSTPHAGVLPLRILIAEPNVQHQTPTGSRIPALMQNAVDDVVKMMSSYYAVQCGERPVQVYTKVQKPGTAMGTTQIQAIFRVFGSVPTIVLLPKLSVTADFSIDCAYWGIGSATLPSMAEVFKCNLDESSDQCLEKLAVEYRAMRENGWQADKYEELLSLVEQKERQEKECRNNHFSPRQTQMYTEQVRDSIRKLARKSFIAELNDEVERLISCAFKLNMSMLADSHFLLEYGTAPIFPLLCQQEISQSPLLQERADEFFNRSIEAGVCGYTCTRAPLLQAKLAHSYISADNKPLAREHYRRGLSCLKSYMGNVECGKPMWLGNRDFCESVEKLAEIHGGEADDFLSSRREELGMPADKLTRCAADLYKDGDVAGACMLWRRAVDLGYAPAANNLAQMYDCGSGVPHDPAAACGLFALAVDAGVESSYRFANRTGNLLLQRGEWAHAFEHYTKYLASADVDDVEPVFVRSSLLLLSDVSQRVAPRVVQTWCIEASKAFAGLNSLESVKSVAVSVLQSLADGGNLPAVDALAVLHFKLAGAPVPFFADADDAANLDWQVDGSVADALHAYVELAIRSQSPRSREFSLT